MKKKQTLYQNNFSYRNMAKVHRIFISKIKSIVFQKSLAKWKLLHFLMAKSVPQLGMHEAYGTEITLHGFLKPNFHQDYGV